jgi:microcompartment protein CcmK/EutM
MQIARVIGTVVATVKNETLEGRKFLIVQTLDADLKPKGSPTIALDAVGAGEGELVFGVVGKRRRFRSNETKLRPTARLSGSLTRTPMFSRVRNAYRKGHR